MHSYTLLAMFLASVPTALHAAVVPTSLTLVGSPLFADDVIITPRDIDDETYAPEIEARAVPADYVPTVLKYHNAHRSNHSARSLTYDNKLASYAATVAASCKFAHNLGPGGGGYGQNLAAYGSSGNVKAMSQSSMIAKAITGMWYNSEYNAFLPSYYGQPTPDTTNFAGYGHLTQIIWNGTASVGCATQYCAPDTIFKGFASWYTVCDYKSAGNVLGSFDKNVFKSLKRPTIKA
ncbi:SCP-like extracellular protein [Phlyctema vagabunda]|uniref:SCP-like extracellular protein n=1 Tax=Phlyctema vagabunda TaxID=108571 RepID=A0ABR4PVT1_9HELO